MQAEEAAGVGDVFGVWFCADVKGAAVKGLADVCDAGGDADDGIFVAGHVVEVDEAEAADVDDDVPEGLAVGFHKLCVVDAPDLLGDGLAVPVDDSCTTLDGSLTR